LSGAKQLVTLAQVTTTLRIGDGTNYIEDNASNQLRYFGTSRNDRTVSLIPEFVGAIIRGDGSNNVGTMTSGFCSDGQNINDGGGANACDTGQEHTYYEWTTAEASAQDYDVYVRWRVPSDFDDSSGFQSNITFNMYGWRTDVTNNSILVNIYNDAGGVCGTADQAVAGTATDWNNLSFAGMGADADCNASAIDAGDYVTFRFRMNADTGDIVRLGEIEISYKSIF
jgi:hypothetical protein